MFSNSCNGINISFGEDEMYHSTWLCLSEFSECDISSLYTKVPQYQYWGCKPAVTSKEF